MNTVGTIALAYIPFLFSAFSISYTAWPKAKINLKIMISLVLAAILLVLHCFLLATTSAGVTFVRLFLCSMVWLFIGCLAYMAYLRNYEISKFSSLGKVPGLSKLAQLGLKGWLALLAALLFGMAFLIIPLLTDLSTNLLWRYRAYMVALAGVAVLGMVTRNKVKTVLVGIALILLVSLAAQAVRFYPIGTPLLEANSLVQEGFQAELPFGDIGDLKRISGLLSQFSLAADAVVALLSVTLIGVASVVLTNGLIGRAGQRTVLVFILVLLLLVPGLLIPYVYSLSVGTLEFGANIGLGALKGFNLIEITEEGDLSNETLHDARLNLIAAGESFERSECLLIGLERLRLFEFVGLLPIIGQYSQNARYLAWGLSNAGKGLQISGLGVVDILNGILIIFDGDGTNSVHSFDLLGPRLMEEDLNETLLAQGILQVDTAFAHIISGFPSIRCSLDNLSQVKPQVFAHNFPDVAEGLEDLLNITEDLGTGIDVAEVFLSHGSNDFTPATHFIYAAYSMARVAPSLMDLRNIEVLPNLDNVISNLSYVSNSLADPTIVRIRKEGGDVGNSIVFVSDAIDLIESMAELGDCTTQVAEGVEEIRRKFEQKQIYNLSYVELAEWNASATALTEHAEDLSIRIDEIEDRIDIMLSKAIEKQYGYTNQLATEGIDMLEEVLMFLKELHGLVDFSYGVRSLVSSVTEFRNFYYDLDRLERQIKMGSMDSALQTAGIARQELKDGRIHTEDTLDRLERLSKEVEIPITDEQITEIIDTATAIELKMTNLQNQISAGNQEESLKVVSEIREDFTDLADELQQLGQIPI